MNRLVGRLAALLVVIHPAHACTASTTTAHARTAASFGRFRAARSASAAPGRKRRVLCRQMVLPARRTGNGFRTAAHEFLKFGTAIITRVLIDGHDSIIESGNVRLLQQRYRSSPLVHLIAQEPTKI